MAKAIGMMSGGLDSTLAVKVIMNQGIEVLGVSFKSAFFGPKKAQAAAKALGIELCVIDIDMPHLDMVKNPRHGYGGNMNPCIDCHGMMFRYCMELLKKEKYDFVFSGEVLGQRPMSQNMNSLKLVAKISGEPDKVLRPMSAKLMRETEMERLGIVNRELLLNIEGRSRKRQMALAKEWGIINYPLPAGGCLLTDPGFSRRLKDMFDSKPNCNLSDMEMLKIGRHIRLNERIKAIVGRNEEENDILSKLKGDSFYFFEAVDFIGPIVILSGKPDEESMHNAGVICAAFGRGAKEKSVSISVKNGDNNAEPFRIINSEPVEKESYKDKML